MAPSCYSGESSVADKIKLLTQKVIFNDYTRIYGGTPQNQFKIYIYFLFHNSDSYTK